MSPGTPAASRNFNGRRFDDFRFRDHDFDDRFRFRNVFVFNGGFGFPFWGGWGFPYAYPYYGYPYYGGYYGYGPGYPGYSGYGPGAGYAYGDQGSRSEVAQLQRQLKAEGYYHGAIDGIMGPRTRSALRASQRDHGMAQNQQPPPRSY